jgi:ATP-dependent HslUV protease ATP-binding subunit HslU
VQEMTPREIVALLDEHIIGQDDAKRAVAVAIRNRWRWRQLPEEIRREVTPKNIIMIGPTGVGKTEITRRLAKLINAPFIKIEATKYTEVGYHGRDVESMARDLVEAAVTLVKGTKRQELEENAKQQVEDRLVALLAPAAPEWNGESEADQKKAEKRHERTRQKFRDMLRAGELEDRVVELSIEQRAVPVQVFSSMGLEQMEADLQNMFERIMPRQNRERRMTIREARKILLEQEIENLLDKDAIAEEAVRLAEESGIIFLDELDKICGPEGG